MSNANDALTFGMSQITSLIEQGFTLFNVNEKKLPTNKRGVGLPKWQTLTADEAKQEHNYQSLLWGLRMGTHANGRRLLSLDFDCCGSTDASGERMGCDYTKGKLQEYQAFGVLEGMYSSSTKGNMNVLVDYTACPTLIDRIGKDSKLNRKGTGLEILCGSKHQQVIPPAMTTCKISGRAENRRAYLSTTPLLLLKEDMDVFAFILSLIDEAKEEEKPKPKPKTTKKSGEEEQQKPKKSMKKVVNTEEDESKEDKYLFLLFNVIKNEADEKGVKMICWDDWFHIAGMLKCNQYDVDTFVKYSEPFASKEEAVKLWNGIKEDTKMDIHGLQNIAKKVNPEQYSEWLKSNWKGVFNDLEAAQVLYSLYPYWKYCQQVLYVFSFETGMWSSKKADHDAVVIKHSDHLYQAHYDGEGKAVVSKTKSYGNTEQLRNRIYSSLFTLCKNDDWLDETQNTSLGKLLFMNGYFDGKTKLFYRKDEHGFNPEIVFFERIPHNFTPLDEAAEEYMDTIKTRYFHLALGEKQGDFLLQTLACGLMGKLMKRFVIGAGSANGGKSLIAKAMQNACGKYVGTFNAENLAIKHNVTDEAQALRWAMLSRHKRLLFSNEIKTNINMSGNMIKKLASGGDKIVGRGHRGDETEFVPHFLCVAFVNDIPQITPYDDGVDVRLRIVNYTKSFVDNPTTEFELKKDEKVETEITEERFKRALVALLVKTYIDLEDKPPADCEEIMNAKRAWISVDDSNPIAKLLAEFEITGDHTNDRVSNEQLEELMKRFKIEMSMAKLTSSLKKEFKLKGYTDRADGTPDMVVNGVFKINGKSKRGWSGIKVIKEEVA